MKKYLYINTIVCMLCTTLIASCSNGNNSSQTGNWTDVSSKAMSQTAIINSICGDQGVDKFILEEAGGEPINTNFNLGQSKGIRSIIQCVNNAKYDVTSVADWSSSDHNIFTVDNQNSKGYITPQNIGDAYLNISYLDGLYNASYKISVNSAVLKSISLSTGRATNKIASGEKVQLTLEGKYSDGSTAIITNANLSSDNENIIKVDNQYLTGIQTGQTTIRASYSGFSTSINMEVIPAKIIGIVMDKNNPDKFTTGIPQSYLFKAKLLLSDNTVLDIPQSTIDSPSIIQCRLQKAPNDSRVPFILTENGCNINSTTDSGENRIVYSYSILDQNSNVIQTFESSQIISSTDDSINNIQLDVDNDLQNGGMLVGNTYRYRIYANLNNGEKIDITKTLSLKALLYYQDSDQSNKIITGDTGYIGPMSAGIDDGNGGVIKLTDYITKDDTSNKVARLILSTDLGKFSAKFDKDITIMPNVMSVKQLSSYFADNIYPKLDSADKRSFETYFEKTDAVSALPEIGLNQKPYFSTTYGHEMIAKLRDDQLRASPQDNQTFSFQPPSSGTVDVALDTTIPRINKIYGSDDPSMTIVTIGCNNANEAQTITTSTIDKQIANTSTVSRGFTIGLEEDVEFGADIGFTVKSTTKISTSADKTWSDSTSEASTYSLSSQNVQLKPFGKTIVVQKVFRTNLAFTGKFNLALTEDSCIPFIINGEVAGFNFNSPACSKYRNIMNKPDDPIFNRLFNGENSMTFFANYASDTATTDAKTNTVAIYAYYPGDQGYDSIDCGTQTLQSSNQKRDISINKNIVKTNTNNITLSPKNLIKTLSSNK